VNLAQEASLTARVKTLVPDLAVEPFAARPEAYRLAHPKGAVLVLYGGTTFDPPRLTAPVMQGAELEVDLILQIRNLNNHEGAYERLNTLRKGLTGWTLPGCKKGYPRRIRFSGAQDGVYQYVLTMVWPTAYAEVVADEPSGPPISISIQHQELP
jgi:hypothetical protein